MKNILFLRLTAIAILITTPVLAKTYVCQMKDRANSGWIPEVVIVQYDQSRGAVIVNDPIIKHYNGSPIPGRVSVNNNIRITFAWKLENFSSRTPGRNQFISGFRYRLTIKHSSLTATITGEPNGYTDQFRGSGQCRIK